EPLRHGRLGLPDRGLREPDAHDGRAGLAARRAPAREGSMSPERPLVSVCVPVYNAERWLAGALESAVAQTYEELEIVVADNASTDASAEIASGFDDLRIRVERSGVTIGAVANHNRAIRLSHGAYVKFLQADDLMLPTS